MFGECHAHVIMDGINYKAAVALRSASYRHHDGVGQILNHIENTAIPSLWGLSYLYGYIRDLLVYTVKHPRKVAHNTAHQHFFQPICQGFK